LAEIEPPENPRALLTNALRSVIFTTHQIDFRENPREIIAEGHRQSERTMRLLAISAPNDEHTVLAVFLLRNAGVEVEFWSPSDAPLLERTCASIGGAGIQISSRHGSDGDRDLTLFNVVLFRKYSKPIVPDHVHPSDEAVVKREFGLFIDNCFGLIGPAAFWVNPWLSLFTCGKLEQLAFARRMGWRIPETLVSYRPEAIRRFHERHKDKGVILKAFAPAVWQDEEGRIFASFTSELTPQIVEDEQSLSSVPGIYQERIDKRYELRVTMFGSFGICVRIDSQASDRTMLDWRAGGADISLRRIEMDERLRAKCVEMMKSLKINFGCFDFIVDKEGEVIFLEVNPAGQFLWIENVDAEIPMLSYFCEFLTGGQQDFRPQLDRRFPALRDVVDSAAFSDFSQAFTAAHPEIKTGMINQE
jgi:hypothetical protein